MFLITKTIDNHNLHIKRKTIENFRSYAEIMLDKRGKRW